MQFSLAAPAVCNLADFYTTKMPTYIALTFALHIYWSKWCACLYTFSTLSWLKLSVVAVYSPCGIMETFSVFGSVNSSATYDDR